MVTLQDRSRATATGHAKPRHRDGRRWTAGRVLGRATWFGGTGLFLIFFALPVLWMILATGKTDGDIIRGHPFALGNWHDFTQTWNNLLAFQDGAILLWMKNSAVYAFGALVITLVTAIPAGYGLALTKFIGRKTLLTITLIVMIMPAAALVLPLYLEINAVNLTGTIWSVILPLSFFPFGVYLTYIYYSSTIPEDLLAAARLDGCTEWQVFAKIAIPLAKPIIALVSFFSFVGNWNNFFLPFVMLPDSQQYPAQVGLNNLLTASAVFNTSAGTEAPILRPELALAALLTILPVLLVFLFSQRALVSGMLAGGTKE
ncbi:sugar ABC transporter permease [Acrocarpospora phusangensis]|uniref:Sugar ABC transporter permease n=1 Tax=Acrocarpospora phusangensis TaxID=1070424 RepID=A0A919Q603_9ACTN|nr:carbohydrate ABC transporter permease [Acrocarpospora phusangensis]GIH22781.1 sugar ABC transporter permease [Acrocarpospora phusangensis]